MIKNSKKLKKNFNRKYSSYNKITKEYDVYILSNEEYDKLSDEEKKEVKFVMVVDKKPGKKGPKGPRKPKGPPAWFKWWVNNEFRPQMQELKQEIKKAIHDLAVKNNLKE